MDNVRKYRITQYITDSGKVVGSRLEEYYLTPSGREVPSSATMMSEYDCVPALKEALENVIIKHA